MYMMEGIHNSMVPRIKYRSLTILVDVGARGLEPYLLGSSEHNLKTTALSHFKPIASWDLPITKGYIESGGGVN